MLRHRAHLAARVHPSPFGPQILSAHDLTKMDLLGQSDPFATVVLEDHYAQTDVIPNEKGPRWPPQARRAFRFWVTNPRSSIYFGVYDFDEIVSSSVMQVQSVRYYYYYCCYHYHYHYYYYYCAATDCSHP